MKFLLDSVIVIDHLNDVSKATEWLAQFYPECCISPITRAEVLTGVEQKNLPNIKLLLAGFTNLVMNTDDADLAAALRKKHRWKLPDAIQAAIALNHKLKLVTRNTKDFTSKHRFVEIPYKV